MHVRTKHGYSYSMIKIRAARNAAMGVDGYQQKDKDQLMDTNATTSTGELNSSKVSKSTVQNMDSSNDNDGSETWEESDNMNLSSSFAKEIDSAVASMVQEEETQVELLNSPMVAPSSIPDLPAAPPVATKSLVPEALKTPTPVAPKIPIPVALKRPVINLSRMHYSRLFRR